MEKYSAPITLKKSFTFCPNAFGIDLYRGCDFGCVYCSANKTCYQDIANNNKQRFRNADIKQIRNMFYTALETDTETNDIVIELLRNRIPLHCGGMSDPFQKREWKYGITKEFIRISNEYTYPVQFCTKAAALPIEYWNILNPKIHAFQVSIMGWDNEYIKEWESNTFTASQRLMFVRELRQNGFWCGVRIQPIIDIEQALKLVYNIGGDCDYVTIEHFRLPSYLADRVLKKFENNTAFEFGQYNLQAKRSVKKKNIERIIRACNSFGVKVGVGDNDFHYMSQSRCCCGIDLIPAFENYLKYNLTYLVTGDADIGSLWKFKCDARKYIQENNSYGKKKIDCEQYVNQYIRQHLDYTGQKQSELSKHLGITKRKLF